MISNTYTHTTMNDHNTNWNVYTPYSISTLGLTFLGSLLSSLLNEYVVIYGYVIL